MRLRLACDLGAQSGSFRYKHTHAHVPRLRRNTHAHDAAGAATKCCAVYDDAAPHGAAEDVLRLTRPDARADGTPRPQAAAREVPRVLPLPPLN